MATSLKSMGIEMLSYTHQRETPIKVSWLRVADKVLLLNTLPATFQSAGVTDLIHNMKSLDFEIVGLGDGGDEIDLLARARQELGFGGPEDEDALGRLEQFFMQVESSEEIDAILWLGKSDDGEGVIGRVIGMADQGQPKLIKGPSAPLGELADY